MAPETPSPETPIERWARRVLDEDLWTWAERQRADDRSWRWIAAKLRELSGGDIQVSKQYLNQLYLRRQAEKDQADKNAGQPAA
jgi:hypothetical protein